MAKRRRKLDPNLIDVYRESYTRQELEKIRRTYAKRANQRMVRLEQAGYRVNEPVTEYLQQQGRRRFSETPTFKGTDAQLKREISALTGFMESERSLVSGRRRIRERTSRTLKERYGVDLSDDELEYLLNNFDDFKSAVSINSDALLQAIGSVSGQVDSKKKILSIVKELKGKKSAQDQAKAVYKAVYGRKRKNKANIIDSIIEAIIK